MKTYWYEVYDEEGLVFDRLVVVPNKFTLAELTQHMNESVAEYDPWALDDQDLFYSVWAVEQPVPSTHMSNRVRIRKFTPIVNRLRLQPSEVA